MSEIQPACYQCGGAFARRVAPPHHRKLRYEGAAHEVLVTDMPEWHCAACELSVTDEEGDEPLQAALRKHVGLLAPQQIKAGIKDLGITQEKFAEKIRCAPESISRWLNGAVLQSRVYDCLMRIYFQFPEVRGALDQFSPDASFGEKVVFGETAVHADPADQKKDSAVRLDDMVEKASFITEGADAFFVAARETASHVFWDIQNQGGQSFAAGSDSYESLIALLYRHSESVESHTRGASNRLSGFDWSRVYGEVAQ